MGTGFHGDFAGTQGAKDNAAEELIAVASRHLRIFKAFGASEVRKSILESLEDNTYRPNSWQSAMYRA